MHYISEFIRAATTEIYNNMVNLPVQIEEGDDTKVPPLKPDGVTACVSFTGTLTANLYMSYNEALAKNVTFTMMGTMPASAAPSEVGDVLGELANMVGGSFKQKMATKGFAGANGAPTVVANAGFTPSAIPGGIALFTLMKIPAASGELEIRVFAKA